MTKREALLEVSILLTNIIMIDSYTVIENKDIQEMEISRNRIDVLRDFLEDLDVQLPEN